MHLKNVRNREKRLAVVKTILNNVTMGIRNTPTYSGCSKNIYYHNNRNNKQKKYHRNHINAVTAVTAVTTAP